jgi:hypothetical protein
MITTSRSSPLRKKDFIPALGNANLIAMYYLQKWENLLLEKVD